MLEMFGPVTNMLKQGEIALTIETLQQEEIAATKKIVQQNKQEIMQHITIFLPRIRQALELHHKT